MKPHLLAATLAFALAAAPPLLAADKPENEFDRGKRLYRKGDMAGAIASWSAWLKKN